MFNWPIINVLTIKCSKNSVKTASRSQNIQNKKHQSVKITTAKWRTQTERKDLIL